MRYIINNNIKYYEDRSELVSLNDDIPPIVLTATLNRLLSALVRNNNLVLSRETLLTQVWEVHGQVASGNNLNNTISILRKAFSSLGEEDIIVTLPRQGFMFAATELRTADSMAQGFPNDESDGETLSDARVSMRVARFKLFGLVVLFILAVGFGIKAWHSVGFSSINTIDAGRIGECSVKFITSYHKVGLGEVELTHLREVVAQKKHIDCRQPATLLYYDSEPLVPSREGKIRTTFFYYCPQQQMNTGQVQCESIYESWGL